MHWVGRVWIPDLGLHDDERDAIYEQHDVGDDEALHAARRIDAELINGVKPIALRACEVDQLHHWVRLARHFVVIDLGLEKQALCGLVGLEKRAIGLA